ncbi:MAG: helix-turn-helix domain-containing protein [Bacteroidota bacterium]
MQNLLIQSISKKEIEDLISKAVSDTFERLIAGIPDAQKEANNDTLLTKKEAAAYLKISSPTLSKYVNDGFIKSHTVAGTRMRFKISDLDKALKSLRNF